MLAAVCMCVLALSTRCLAAEDVKRPQAGAPAGEAAARVLEAPTGAGRPGLGDRERAAGEDDWRQRARHDAHMALDSEDDDDGEPYYHHHSRYAGHDDDDEDRGHQWQQAERERRRDWREHEGPQAGGPQRRQPQPYHGVLDRRDGGGDPWHYPFFHPPTSSCPPKSCPSCPSCPQPFQLFDQSFAQRFSRTTVAAPGVLTGAVMPADCTSVTLEVVKNPASGTVTLNANNDGGFLYVPNNAASPASDSFIVKATCAPSGQVSYATITLTPPAFVKCTTDGSSSTLIEASLWSVAAAPLQDHTPIADGGPNLILNGDFSFDGSGVEQNGATDLWALIVDQSGLSPPKRTLKAIQHWSVGGGGDNTYAAWGGEVPTRFETGTCPGCSASVVYFGNGFQAKYTDTAGTGSFSFNADGFGQSSTLTLIPNPAGAYGTTATPAFISQSVTGLKVGTRYRLQFWVSSEDGALDENTQACSWFQTGIAAVRIEGYATTYFSVTHQRRYLTLDFVAKSATTTIEYDNWGHILISGPQGVNNPNPNPAPAPYPRPSPAATELALDDVILTQCATP